MCWNIEVSLLAGVYGYAVSIYLHQRRHTSRDWWYGLFLASFSTTQVIDAVLWWIKENSDVELGDDPSGDMPCTTLNWAFSKFLIPPVIFFQPVALSVFPSTRFVDSRKWYRLLAVIGALIPMIFCGCTTLYDTTGLWKGQTLLYGGIVPSWLLMAAGIVFWSVGISAYAFPYWVARNVLLVGGFNLILLVLIDGTIRLVSKLCFYCLLLSIMWLLEPLFVPPDDLDWEVILPKSNAAVTKEAPIDSMHSKA